MMDRQLHESTEDYLEAVLVLERSRGFVRAVDIACLLDVSKASVSKALGKLSREGYVEVVAHDVRLTSSGRDVAERILERHEFFRNLLERAGVDAATASCEACRMEHCLSEDSFKKLVAYLEEPVEQALRACG